MENNQEDIKPVEGVHVPKRPADFKPDPRPTTDVLFGIDELLDVRLGTLARIDTKLASEVLNSGKYFTRTIDEFPGWSLEKFRELYDKRDADTLPYCLATNVTILLERIVKDALLADASGDAGQNPMVFNLNIWPYELYDDEIAAMVKCVEVFTLGYGDIKVVNLSPEDLTPKYIKEHFDLVICYDYQKILALHDGEFVKTPCPGVSLVIPTMYKGGRPDKEAFEWAASQGKSLFEITRLGLLQSINLKFQDTSLFCISDVINPSNKDRIIKAVSVTADDILKAAEVMGDKIIIENKEELLGDAAKGQEGLSQPASGDNVQNTSADTIADDELL